MSDIGNFDIRTHIIGTIVDTFDTMMSMKIEVSDSDPPDGGDKGRMAVAVNFSGNVTGMLNIQLSADLARLMVASKLDSASENVENDDEIRKVLADISNIVSTNLKSALNDAGHDCVMAPPSITDGADFPNTPSGMDRIERCVFSYQEELILAEVCLKSQQDGGAEDDISSPDVLDGPKQINFESSGDGSAEDNTAEEVIVAASEENNEVPEAAATQSTAETPQQPELSSQPTADQVPNPLLTASSKQQATSQSTESNKKKSPEDFYLDLLLDIPLEIKVELGRTQIQIQELLNLSPGSAVKLVKLEGEPVDILANGTLIARGEVVIQKEKYGIRVTEITSRIDRIKSFSI